MRCIERFHDLRNDELDAIMCLIEEGAVKCGKYAKVVKPTSRVTKRKEFFNDGRTSKDERE